VKQNNAHEKKEKEWALAVFVPEGTISSFQTEEMKRDYPL